ncbi:MAG: hypothetical protein IJR99_10490 [Kiritimatiellae bacterium]|nr:hypothetical protein [Kiritimatiellia bacterium]
MNNRLMLVLSVLTLCSAAFAEVPQFEGNLNTNGAGRVKVTVAPGDSLLAASFAACLTATNANPTITVTELVSTNGLPAAASVSEADEAARLFVLENGQYKVYYNDAVNGWTAYASGSDTGSLANLSGEDADTFAFTPGDGFWFRLPGEASREIYLTGDVLLATQESITAGKGLNLLGTVLLDDWPLNTLSVANPYKSPRLFLSDYISVVTASGTVNYYWNGTTFVTTDGQDYRGATVKKGTGVRYFAKNAGPVITLKQE